MFKEFFLRRRAYKVGMTIRHSHDSANIQAYTGRQLLALAKAKWEQYCESVSPKREWETATQDYSRPTHQERKLLANDALRATYINAFIQGYLADDTPRYWPEETVKE